MTPKLQFSWIFSLVGSPRSTAFCHRAASDASLSGETSWPLRPSLPAPPSGEGVSKQREALVGEQPDPPELGWPATAHSQSCELSPHWDRKHTGGRPVGSVLGTWSQAPLGLLRDGAGQGAVLAGHGENPPRQPTPAALPALPTPPYAPPCVRDGDIIPDHSCWESQHSLPSL